MEGREIILAEPHGFCAGVKRAIAIAEKTLAGLPAGAKLYCLHALVHNEEATGRLTAKGVVFVDSLAEIPDGANVLFGAHGVSPAVREEAARRHMAATDATCPAVARLHESARRFAAEGRDVILIGTRGHDETTGVAGEAPGRIRIVENAKEAESLDLPYGAAPAILMQTTLSALQAAPTLSALERRFPRLAVPGRSGTCSVTEERQAAVRALAAECDFVIVVGSESSANAKRLANAARKAGARAALVRDLDAAKAFAASGGIGNARRIAVASAASTPGETVEAIADWLRNTDCGTTA